MTDPPTAVTRDSGRSRPFVPSRDLVVGPVAHLPRHLRARTTLLRWLLEQPDVRHAFDAWVEGLVGRAALSMLRRPAALSMLRRPAAPLAARARAFAGTITQRLGLPGTCRAWLTAELLSWFFDSITATVTGRPVQRVYRVEPLPARPEPVVVPLQVDLSRPARDDERAAVEAVRRHRMIAAGAGVRARRPKQTDDHVERYVNWLVRHAWLGVPQRELAREWAASDPAVTRSASVRGVQYGIARARAWLAMGATAEAGYLTSPD